MTFKIPPLKIIITAGPTVEPIDAVRFISNYSTGTIGYELAKAAAKRHHRVILISGPVDLDVPKNVLCLRVDTAKNMQEAVNKHFKWCDCLIMAAAVSDYRPKRYITQKLKKTKKKFSLELIQNPDILKGLGKRKENKILIGFALETENVIQNARRKLKEKNLDFIVANIRDSRMNPFGKRKIDVYLIDKNLIMKKFNNISKKVLALRILDRMENLWYNLYRKK